MVDSGPNIHVRREVVRETLKSAAMEPLMFCRIHALFLVESLNIDQTKHDNSRYRYRRCIMCHEDVPHSWKVNNVDLHPTGAAEGSSGAICRRMPFACDV
jgi:hypothetical protein